VTGDCGVMNRGHFTSPALTNPAFILVHIAADGRNRRFRR